MWNSRNNKSIVDEITTLRRHLEAIHSVGQVYDSAVPFEHILLSEVSKLGKECQFLVEATRRCQKTQGICRRGNPYTGPSSQGEKRGCPLFR